MNFVDNIADLKAEHYILASLCFLALFSPGLLGLAMYFPDEFMDISSLKLVLVSFAVGLPIGLPHIVAAGFVFSATSHTVAEKHKFVPVLGTIFGALSASISSYSVIAVAYFSGMGIKSFVATLIGAEFGALFVWVFAYRKMKSRNTAPNHEKNEGQG